MRKLLFIVITIISGFIMMEAQGNLKASEVLNRAVGKIALSKGVESKFKIYNSGYSGNGVIKMSGEKYNVVLPDIEVWYNGKELYTYNKRTNETSVVIPTAEEIAESNPLAYVTGAAKTYNCRFSTVKKADRYVLELEPKIKGDIKRITLTLKKSDYMPEKIVVEPASGNPITADISDFKTGMTLPASTFEYPKSKYPGVELIDLR